MAKKVDPQKEITDILKGLLRPPGAWQTETKQREGLRAAIGRGAILSEPTKGPKRSRKQSI